MSAGSLAAKAALVLIAVALIGKYTDHTHHPSSPAAAPAAIRALARTEFGTGADYRCAAHIITHESSWDPHATNPRSRAYGLPQALPADKMAAAGPDWRTNPATQLAWMHSYVDHRYGGACPAWSFWQAHHWY